MQIFSSCLRRFLPHSPFLSWRSFPTSTRCSVVSQPLPLASALSPRCLSLAYLGSCPGSCPLVSLSLWTRCRGDSFPGVIPWRRWVGSQWPVMNGFAVPCPVVLNVYSCCELLSDFWLFSEQPTRPLLSDPISFRPVVAPRWVKRCWCRFARLLPGWEWSTWAGFQLRQLLCLSTRGGGGKPQWSMTLAVLALDYLASCLFFPSHLLIHSLVAVPVPSFL